MILIIPALLLHVVFFLRLAQRMRAGTISRRKAVGLYALVGLAPTVLLVGSFLMLVGVEELFSVAIISEGVARAAPLVAGALLFLWILCSVVFAFYAALARSVE